MTADRDSAPARDTASSRLDPEPVPRRDFLGLAAGWSAVVALGFATLGMLRLPKAAVLASPSKKFRVSLPESLVAGEPHLPAGRSVALFREGDEIYAISTICTHLGCVVKPAAVVTDGFDCPCHGSKFASDGAVVRGPAPKGLPWLAVTILGKGEVLVDEGKTVPAGTKAKVSG